MAIWTLVTTLGDGSGGRTNGFPNDWIYPGTFTHVGSSGTNKVYAVASLNQPENDSTGAQWIMGLPNVVAPGFTANSNIIPLDNPINCCVPIATAPLVVPAPIAPNVTINASGFTSEAIPGCAGGLPFTRWVQKDGTGAPTGTEWYTDNDANVVTIPVGFTIGDCNGIPRVFISTQLLSLTTSDSTLTVPTTANWGEVYVVGGGVIWSLTNTSTQGVNVDDRGEIIIESRSELLAFKIKAVSTATLIINYFTT